MKKQLMGIWFLAMVLLTGWAVAAAAGDLDAFKGASGTLKISGGTAHIPVMKVAAQKIMTAHADIKISIAGGGSGVGIKQVGEGLVDIGNSGRKPSETELKKYSLKMHQWAIDGVGVVVNPNNPVKSLTTANLKDIYAGKLTNWKALGGPDKTINLYTRDKASGTRAVFWKKALSKGDISAKAHFVPSNGAMKTAIAQDPYAIGYVSVGHIDKSVAPVSLDGVVPTLDNVKQGKYKVARGLYSNTRGDTGALAQKFIDYLYSAEGQKIVAEKGFIPVN
ncbi:MAG: phosphate ABC transporter substrate-binding protein [Desulfobacteraceae bacterium]|jgi:phosphate transport system substrate-binding protein